VASRVAPGRIVQSVVLVLVALLLMGGIAYYQARKELLAASSERYAALRDVRAQQLERYLEGAREATRFWSSDRVLRNALTTFRTAWAGLGDDPKAALQKLFIADNPFPVGERDALAFVADGSDYAAAHASYHEWFRRFVTHQGFYDVFLIDPDGNLVYTVFKEMDYATNLETGRYHDTGLARAFRAAAASRDPDFVAFSDFELYAPSRGAPAAFLASPVLDGEGGLEGVLAFQVSADRINEIMQVELGMGRSGETYVVGSDRRMRSSSRFSSERTVLATEVDTAPVRAALAGETGVELGPDYRGVDVVSAYAPLEFQGVRWAVLAEIDESEVYAPVTRLGRAMTGTGLLTSLVCFVGTLATAGRVG